jgi:hypothetical protein
MTHSMIMISIITLEESRSQNGPLFFCSLSTFRRNAAEKSEESSLNEDEVILTSDDVWTRVKAEIKGAEIKQSWETEEYGAISQRKLLLS